jgi:hypothetical protein
MKSFGTKNLVVTNLTEFTMGWFGGILQKVEPCRKFRLDLFGTGPSGSGSMRMQNGLWLR